MNLVPFAFRNSLEQLLRSFGVHEAQARQAAFAGPDGFDLTEWEPKKAKAYAQPRPEEPDLIVTHVTDVTGGFGVSRRRVGDLAKRIEDWTMRGEIPNRIWEQLPDHTDPMKMAQRLALWERYRNLPYHQIGAANGDVIKNHGLMRWSWHGNGGNRRGVGWAADCGHDQELDDFLIETFRLSLRKLIGRMNTEPIDVAPHRAYSAGRRVDTDVQIWVRVIKPVVKEFDHVRIDYEAKAGRGRPVPTRWDEDALFDWKGRRLK